MAEVYRNSRYIGHTAVRYCSLNLVLAEHELIVGVTVLTESQRVLRQKMRVPAETTRELIAFLRREAVVVGKAPALPTTAFDQ